MIKIFAFVALALIATTAYTHAACIVADPTPTPLNVRTAPYGRITATLDNGQSVYIIDHTTDRQSREWVYVSDPDTDKPIGWVYRDYIVCKGSVN